MNAFTPLWPHVEPLIAAAQPQQRMRSPNGSGWITDLRSPLRPDAHAGSFSVRPDSPTDPGAWKDFSINAGEEKGSMADLARRLGLDPCVSGNGHRPEPRHETTLAGFCERREISRETLRRFGVQEGTHAGRAALLWPTPVGVRRVKYLDGASPKYRWERAGGKRHLYGVKTIRPGEPVYLVNGEPSVWACYEAGVPAFCLGGGEGAKLTPEMLEQLSESDPGVVRVAYDRDAAGRSGAHAAAAQLREAGIQAVAVELPAKLGPKGDVDDLHRWEGPGLGEVLAALPELPAGDTAPAPGSGLIVTTLADVEPEDVRWLWRDRIPLGKLTLMVGDPGDGKSYLSMAMAAALTRGAALPEGDMPDGPAHVLLANYEDGLADTIRKRADLLGADVRRLHVIEGTRDKEGRPRPFDTGDLPNLESELDRRPDIRLLVVDPVVSLVGGSVDNYRDNEIRAALNPLVAMASRRRIAVLGIMHLRKGEASRAIYRVSGSGGYVALARSVLLVAQDPESGRRAIAHIKSTLATKTEPLEFRIADSGIEWLGVAPELSAERLLGPGPSESPSVRDAAEAFLIEELTPGPQPARDLFAGAEEQGIAKRTLERAKSQLGIIACKRHEAGGGRGAGAWEWMLPGIDGGVER